MTRLLSPIKANTCPYCGAGYTLAAGGCVASCPESERIKVLIREALDEEEAQERARWAREGEPKS